MQQQTAPDLDHPFFARFYRRNRESAQKRGEDEHRRRLLAGLRGRVVEIGAGDGANFEFYPPEVEELIAVEPERNLRSFAEQEAERAPVNVRVVRGFAEELPLGDGSVDAAVVSLVLCSVPDQAEALAEVRRVLRPGGELRFYEHVHARRQPLRLLLEVADRSGLWPRIAGGCHPTRDTGAAIEAAGFSVKSCESIDFSPSAILPGIPHLLGSAHRS